MDMNVGMGGPNSEASVRLAVHPADMAQLPNLPVLTAEVSRKPLIGFLWAGTILLFIGLAISMHRRFTEESMARRVPRNAAKSGDDSPIGLKSETSPHIVRPDAKKISERIPSEEV